MTRTSLVAFVVIAAISCPALAVRDAGGEGGGLAFAPELVREGRFLVEADGVLRMVDDGWAFETIDTGKIRTFTLSPCLRLGELEQVVGARGEGRYRLSGRVFVHKDRNYLLITSFAAPGIDDASPLNESSPTGGPTVADLVRDFERQRGDRPRQPGRANDRSREATPVRREGATLTMVRGRVLQNPAGWAYFEPLPDEGALEPDPAATLPVMMLPSLMLEELESLAAFSREAPLITLSGEFYAHQGRNYLLPRMYLIERSRSRDADAPIPTFVGEFGR